MEIPDFFEGVAPKEKELPNPDSMPVGLLTGQSNDAHNPQERPFLGREQVERVKQRMHSAATRKARAARGQLLSDCIAPVPSEVVHLTSSIVIHFDDVYFMLFRLLSVSLLLHIIPCL
jgi:hypothetical protein